ncbi:uncharacterized protein LOC128271848 isoform X2 [Anopheles cruzii]|uniref:uncharacterized protein LOC128271848 isoform X2 n=1 Tax=Anopheles cruzii TaxID=68878 RepID=UPI0022EC1CB5|nr:uncharacterized protein LOC128271848 isoform X2 [Anopheles cruzii]
MSEPIVVILSVDQTVKPESIVEKIRKQPNDQNQSVLSDPPATTTYRYHIHTKYYDTDVLLYPHDSAATTTLPSAILKRTEGILIYFDAHDRTFLERLPAYGAFVQQQKIEFGILLCTALLESESEGLTYGEAKQLFTVLDVIELEPSADDDDEVPAGEAIGVDELIQAMHNHIWSNVKMHRGNRLTAAVEESSSPHDDGVGDAADVQGPVCDEEERMLEAALTGFEKLLTEVRNFQPNTTSWSRNERLAYAQELAEMFDNLVEDDD